MDRRTGTSESAQFPIGVWIQDPTRIRGGQNNAVNYKAVGVNTFVGLWDFPAEAATARMQAAQNAGMKVIAGTDTNWIKSHPEFADTFQGYLLGDEPDLAGTEESPDAWKARGDAIRAADPDRDLYGNFGRSICDYPNFGYSGDPNTDFPKYTAPLTIASCGMYSMTDTSSSTGMWDYGEGVDNLERWAPGKKVWGFVEGSAPFEDGGRITATQLKQAAWQIVVHGADGLQYFCHDFDGGGFVEDGCLAQSGIPQAMTEVDNEIQGYAEALAQPDVSGTTATGTVTTLTKRLDGATFVFAQSDGSQSLPNGYSGSSTIRVAGVTSGTATVVGEDRTLAVTNGAFTDSFTGYQHHVYRIVAGGSPDPTPTRPRRDDPTRADRTRRPTFPIRRRRAGSTPA